MNRRFVSQMLRREVRASRRHLLLYGSCMALGIAALVGLHGLRATTYRALDAQSQKLLGADLRIASRAPIQGDAGAAIAGFDSRAGVQSTRMTRFGSMALALSSERSRLVNIQGIEESFPLYGAIETQPPGQLEALHRSAAPLALVDPSLLIQLDTKIGEEMAIGAIRFRIVGTIAKAPGSFGMQTQIAPRVFIAHQHIAATELIRPGSLVEYLVFLRSEPIPLAAWLAANRATLEDARLRIQTVEGYQADLNRSFAAMTRYLGLVGLTALALGGVGVAAGIRVFVREKLESVALLRSLGAGSRDIAAVYGSLALALGFLAGSAGALLGSALQWLLPHFIQGLLPVELTSRFEPAALGTGILLGLWVTLLFATGPLIDLLRVPPLRALRADFATEPLPIRGRLFLFAALAVSLVAVSLWQAPRPTVGLAFAAGLAAALGTLAGAALACSFLLRRFFPRSAPYWLRQGVANLFRPRNHTVSTVLTIGFGLFLISTLHSVQRNVMQQLAVDARPDRPNLVLFDVQPDQTAALEDLLQKRGAAIRDRAPLISARIAELDGRSISERLSANREDRELRWALQREYRLTYGAALRESETIVAGSWWGEGDIGAEEPIPVSVEMNLATSLGLAIGDAVTWDIQGVPVTSVVTNLREVDWGRFATNFFVVFPPGLIEQAPRTTVILARIEGDAARASLQRDLVHRFSNISVLDASIILSAMDTMMSQVAVAIRVLALFTLATGFMILIAATATARDERAREGLLLRTLGASTATLRRVITTEAIALGILAVGVGSGLALAASWALVRFVFELPFEPPWLDLGLLALATLGICTALGATGGAEIRRTSPLAALRAVESAGMR